MKSIRRSARVIKVSSPLVGLPEVPVGSLSPVRPRGYVRVYGSNRRGEWGKTRQWGNMGQREQNPINLRSFLDGAKWVIRKSLGNCVLL